MGTEWIIQTWLRFAPISFREPIFESASNSIPPSPRFSHSLSLNGCLNQWINLPCLRFFPLLSTESYESWTRFTPLSFGDWMNLFLMTDSVLSYLWVNPRSLVSQCLNQWIFCSCPSLLPPSCSMLRLRLVYFQRVSFKSENLTVLSERLASLLCSESVESNRLMIPFYTEL